MDKPLILANKKPMAEKREKWECDCGARVYAGLHCHVCGTAPAGCECDICNDEEVEGRAPAHIPFDNDWED